MVISVNLAIVYSSVNYVEFIIIMHNISSLWPLSGNFVHIVT
jgi:hypothetical protein